MNKIDELLENCEKLGREYQSKHKEIETMYQKYKELSKDSKINKNKAARINELIESTKKHLMSKEEFDLLKKEQEDIMAEFKSLEKFPYDADVLNMPPYEGDGGKSF